MRTSPSGLKLATLLGIYRWRLRRHAIQELLAVSGIAAGVALVFGVLVTNASITGSAEQLARSFIGSAQLQLAARSSAGFQERLAERAGELGGVMVASPLLRENVTIVGPKGREPIELVGLTPSLVALTAIAAQSVRASALLRRGGLALPSGVAEAIGARTGHSLTLLAGGDLHTVALAGVLGGQTIGPAAASSPLALALLPVAQRLVEQPGRVTQVFIKPRPGEERLVAGELRRLAAGRLDVGPADRELALLRATAKPNDESTSLFALIGAMVGLLLALNAMLLTAPERRRAVVELWMQGFEPRQIVLILGCQAMMLALVGSLAGVLLGDLLAHTLFGQVPSYLSDAFPIGDQRVIRLSTILVAFGSGVAITLLACAPPLLQLRRGRPINAVLGEASQLGGAVSKRTARRLAVTGAALVMLVLAVVLELPSLTAAGGAILPLAGLCCIPAVYDAVLGAVGRLSRHVRGSMLMLAVMQLRASTIRSIALAGVAALAVYGTVAIGGARQDLLRGLDESAQAYAKTAQVWVVADENLLTVTSFRGGEKISAIAHAPGVASARVYQGGLLDTGTRRLWIRARPPADNPIVDPSQLLKGNLTRASELMRKGGWAEISDVFASERHLHVGGSFTLPTPSGNARLGVAAITTNNGWPPGVITLNTSDYRRYWQTDEPTALEINLKPGVSAVQGKVSVRHALGDRSGLYVLSYHERLAGLQRDSRQGLQTLSQISTLLIIAAALAVASALSATIWQRRRRLASLKIQGFGPLQLWRALLLESAIVLCVGCVVGVVFGVCGHALASRWLELGPGYPARFSLDAVHVLSVLAVLAGTALAVLALPGYAAAQVSTHASSEE